MITNKLRICKLIYEKRQNDAQITAQIVTLIDAQILDVVTNLKDTLHCNRTQELNDKQPK